MKRIIAAVLMVILCFTVTSCEKEQGETVGGIPEGQEIYDVVPMIPVDGNDYIISTRAISFASVPDDYVYGGIVEKGGYEGCEYYTNEAQPLWIYVKVQTNSEEEKYEYFRFVDEEIRGKDYVCVNGVLYVSGWTADYKIDYRDNIFGDIRIEGDLPEGFESLGKAEFSGYDTVPEGALSSNTGSEEVFINENDDSVVLVPTTWHTYGNVRHTGFNVYIVEE